MRGRIAAGLAVLALAGCSSTPRPPSPSTTACTQVGSASWYQPGGRKAADGERHDSDEMIAAHRFLPLGTEVLVTDLDTGRSVRVRISDRGPFVKGRIIDLSAAAARRLGLKRDGVAEVELRLSGGGVQPCPFAAT